MRKKCFNFQMFGLDYTSINRILLGERKLNSEDPKADSPLLGKWLKVLKSQMQMGKGLKQQNLAMATRPFPLVTSIKYRGLSA